VLSTVYGFKKSCEVTEETQEEKGSIKAWLWGMRSKCITHTSVPCTVYITLK
jgi:hypothetical protein